MPLNKANLFKVAGANPQIHIYKTPDTIANMTGANYFNGAKDELRQHDIIIAVGSTGGTPTVDVLVVTSADGVSPVTVVNGT
jgi:hypothetical protein